jgi:hypothetical protein
MDALRFSVHESMFILDGGPAAQLPRGSGGPVLAGPEAVFVAGRVESDAPTLFRIGQPGGEAGLILAHSGSLATPRCRLRVVSVAQEVLGEVSVPGPRTSILIYMTDLDEPDEIFVCIPHEQRVEAE